MKANEYVLLFNKKDFQSMTLQVMDIDPFEHNFFKSNGVFQNVIEGIDNKVLIRYITLFYDPKSPLPTRINDHIERKKAAALIAGFKDKNESFPKAIEDILYCKNKKANMMIVEYLRYLKNPDWAFLCTNYEAYYKILIELVNDAESLSEKGSSKTTIDIAVTRTKLSEQADIMAEKLSERTLKFMAQDTSPYLKDHLFDLIETEQEKPKITAERMAFN